MQCEIRNRINIQKIEKVKSHMRQEIEKTPYSRYLLSIPGINVVTVAIFLGEIGDPASIILVRR